MMFRISLITSLLVLGAAAASAQSFEAGVHVASSKWSEFDGADKGIGGRLTWKPVSMIGVDADVTFYPSDFPPDRIAFSGRRWEGLFGVTVGPQIDRVRPFAKAAGGFLQVGETPIVFACVAIFPPPLSCLMAGGHTLPAYEIGGGVEVTAPARTFVRADVTDRFLKYPGPAFDANFQRRDQGFFGGALRVTLGGGIRF